MQRSSNAEEEKFILLFLLLFCFDNNFMCLLKSHT